MTYRFWCVSAPGIMGWKSHLKRYLKLVLSFLGHLRKASDDASGTFARNTQLRRFLAATSQLLPSNPSWRVLRVKELSRRLRRRRGRPGLHGCRTLTLESGSFRRKNWQGCIQKPGRNACLRLRFGARILSAIASVGPQSSTVEPPAFCSSIRNGLPR